MDAVELRIQDAIDEAQMTLDEANGLRASVLDNLVKATEAVTLCEATLILNKARMTAYKRQKESFR